MLSLEERSRSTHPKLAIGCFHNVTITLANLVILAVSGLEAELAMKLAFQLQLIFLAIAFSLFVGCRSRPVVVHPLPAITDVLTVTASYFDSDSNKNIRFDVPLSQLPAIFAALEPAVLDPMPSKWIGLGDMKMTLSGGRRFQVDFYELAPTEQGAFSAGETYEQRIYYRGGSSQKLLDALRAAYDVAGEDRRDNDMR